MSINTPTTWDDPVVCTQRTAAFPSGVISNPDQRKDVADRLFQALKQARQQAPAWPSLA